MKKLMLLSMLCCSIASLAQNGFYRAASYGMGRSSQNLDGPEGSYEDISFESTTAWQASLDMGYKLHNWRFVAGVQYLADGYDALSGSPIAPSPYRVQARFYHLTIPVRVGYSINILKKLAIVPYIGASAGYNFNPVQIDRNNGQTKTTATTNEDFKYFEYKRISLWALGQVDVRYQLGKNLAVTAGPRYNMMLGTMQKPNADMRHIEPMRLNSYTINVGIDFTMPSCMHCCHKGKGETAAK